MITVQSARDLDTMLDALVERATRVDAAPAALTARARAATRRALGHLDAVPFDDLSADRVSRYFAAVLRRTSALPGPAEVAAYRRRAIAASLATDLRDAGFDESRIAEELQACIGSTLDELRAVGCS